MSSTCCKIVLDLDVILRFDVHKAMLQNFTFIGPDEVMEVPDITLCANLLLLILVLRRHNEVKFFFEKQ